jgi:lysophospholipase L1-like esterase
MRFHTFAAALVAAASIAVITTASPAGARESSACTAPVLLTALRPSLEQSGARLGARQAVTIVAIGSSSTQGVGASQPALNYPSRLEAELKARLPGIAIRVINHGKGGEDVGEEVARLRSDVLAEHPDLVIWQVGTNAVLRRDDLSADGELMRRGIAEIKSAGIDIVLMDMQYAPRVLARPAYGQMEDLIAAEADRGDVPLFRRFAMMRYWQGLPGSPNFVSDDGLHMNDAGYGCLAVTLADALVANWSSHIKTVQIRQPDGSNDLPTLAIAGHKQAGTEH